MDSLLQIVLAIGVIVGGLGYAVGQFMSQRRKGGSDALTTAIEEVQAIRIRTDRLEREVGELQEANLRLASENKTMRELLQGGTFLAEQLQNLVRAEIVVATDAILAAMIKKWPPHES